MDKVQRIRQYLKNSEKKSESINIDLSKILDTNHSKHFASKELVSEQLKNITSDYTIKLDKLKENTELSDTQLVNRIEKLNIELADKISEVVSRIDREKIELSETFVNKLEQKALELHGRIDLVNEPVIEIIDTSKKRIAELEGSISKIAGRLGGLKIPKPAIVKAGKNVKVDTKETEQGIEYTVSSKAEQNIHMLHNIGVQQIIAGNNISLSPADGKGIVTITSTAVGVSTAGSTFYAGAGIDITGSTITNTLPGVSLQAGNNITIVGVTISATGGAGSTVYAGNGINITGGTITNTLGFVGTGGVSVSLTGNTYTIFGLSSALNSNQITEGVSNFYYTEERFNSSLGTKTTNNLSEGSSGLYYSQQRFDSALALKTTDNLSEGVSNFYYRADRIVGIGGASVTRNGLTLSIYAQSTGSPAWGDITGTLSAQTDLSNALITKLSGTSTTDLLNEGVSNFYYNPKTFTGTGGVSVSVTGKTVTIYGASYQIGTNLVPEGPSNFYYRADRFVGTGGVSVSTTGYTLTIYGASTKVNTNETTEGASGLYYSTQRFTTDFGNKTTNDLTEGTSNFYFKPTYVIGTGGVSVSVSGRTITVFGLSTALNTNNAVEGASGLFYSVQRFGSDFANKTTNDLTEGTSNFYYKPIYFVGSNGTSVSVLGKTVTIYSSTVGGGSTVYAGNGINITGGTISNTVLGLSALNDVAYTGLSDTNLLTFNGSQWVNTDKDNYISTQTNVNSAYVHSQLSGQNPHQATIDQIVGVSINTATPGDFFRYSVNGEWTNDAINTDDILEGVSNFYYKPNYFVGTGGVSVSINGVTVTVYGNSTIVNTNNVTEGNSGLFYSSVRFDASFSTKTTNNLSEGTSNFYYNPLNFLGTGGVSVSVTGKTITIFGLSNALNSNQISEGTSNFYWRTDRLKAGAGVSIYTTGLSAQIGLNITGISAQYLGGNGVYIAPLQSKSFYLEGLTSTDFIPFYRVEQSMALVKTVYDISGGTHWGGQVQKWNNAQGGVKTDTQSADSDVATTVTVTSFTGASFLAGDYMAIKGASIAGGVSWLLVNVYFREN